MKTIKRFALCLLGSIFLSMALIQPSYAQEVAGAISALLAKILETTTSILVQVQLLPVYLTAYLKSVTEMADSWIDTKDSDVIANNQYAFASLNKSYTDSVPQQISVSKNLTQKFLLASSIDRANPALPSNANELGYTVLVGAPLTNVSGSSTTSPQQQAEALAQAYIRNISGVALPMKQANPAWKDSEEKLKYQSVYNTVSAISSYNAYILSSLLKQQEQDTLRNNLIDQASNSEWFTQVASETLGLVLRQMLMYLSQIYVQLDRLTKVQQQQLTTQVMTNTLLIINMDGLTIQALSQRAQMAQPGRR
jgi:hypothetical protein